MMRRIFCFIFLCSLMCAACGGDDGDGGTNVEGFTEDELIAMGPCAEDNENRPDLCGSECQEDDAFPNGLCGDGFYCRSEGEQAGTCTAQCDPMDLEAFPCPGEAYCTAYGRCVDLNNVTDAVNSCEDTIVQGKKETATIHMLVDMSGSMDRDLSDDDDRSRWQVVLDILRGTDDTQGLIDEFDGLVRFGMSVFSTQGSGGNSAVPGYRCLGTNANILPGDFGETTDDIVAALPNAPAGGTPTGEMLKKLIDDVEAGDITFDSSDPAYFLLITDGGPRFCDGNLDEVYTTWDDTNVNDDATVFASFNPGLNYTQSQIARARESLGVNTYVVGLGTGNSEALNKIDLDAPGEAGNKVTNPDLTNMLNNGVFAEANWSTELPYVDYGNIPANALANATALRAHLVDTVPDYAKTLDSMASAGGTTEHYSAVDEGSFAAALQSIVSDNVSCELRFGSEAEIPPNRVAEVCENVTVVFDSSEAGDQEGEALACQSDAGADEGWVLSESRTKVVLLGETCELFKQNPDRLKDINLGCNFAILE